MPTCQETTCGKAIDWARKAGTHGGQTVRMPFDRELFDQPGGEYAVWRDGRELVYRKLGGAEALGPGEHLGTSHYRTCTKASQFSKRSGASR